MQLKDTPSSASEELWFDAIGKPVPLDKTGTIGYIEKRGSCDFLLLSLCGEVYVLKAKKKRAPRNIDFHFKRGSCCLAEVISVGGNGVVNLRIVFFRGDILRTGDLYLSASSSLRAESKQSLRELRNFMLEVPEDDTGSLSYYYIMSLADSFVSRDDEAAEAPSNRTAIEALNITLHGKGARLSAVQGADGMQITRLIRSASNQQLLPYLCQGKLIPCEQKRPLSEPSAFVFNKIGTDIQEYLNLLDQYSQVESENLMARARSIGQMKITASGYDQGRVKLYLDRISGDLTDKDSLELMAEEPLYFQDREMSFQEYVQTLKTQKSIATKDRRCFNILSINRTPDCNYIITDLEKLPANDGILILSIRGNEVQIERQRKAREILQNGTAANPLLGDIIAGVSNSHRRAKYDQIPALSQYVCDKVFKNPPTGRQKEAISVALNTPDIALIQGPPGTGKTTVITAIIERLNELADTSRPLRGQILISGFQHDAVENIISRLRVNSLPSLKFGGRAKGELETQVEEEENIKSFIAELASGTRARNPEIMHQERVAYLPRLAKTYLASPTNTNAELLLSAICSEPLVPKSLKQEAQQQRDILRPPDIAVREERDILPYIRALRCNEVSFADDGALRAQILLDEIKHSSILQEAERTLLENAASWFGTRKPPFLDRLKVLRRNLIERCLPRPEFRTQKVNLDILRLARQAHAECEKLQHSSNKLNSVIAAFLHNLEYDPDSVREVLKNYNFVYAATTQQCDGREIKQAKGVQEPDYDTVIVDEAARCSPRDLLIPMTKARNRILLVGDHRQLPHIVDEEIVRKLEQDESEQGEVGDLLRISMFEYMFKQLRKLEQQDGIKRTVTLDAQYRTHPVLGDFVSKSFYADKGEGFSSPLKAELFDHELPGIEHKAAVWVDVPFRKGAEERTPSGSRFRKAEVRIIAEYLHKYIDSEQGQKLSFGVISFYKAQVESLLKALAPYGYTERIAESQFYQVKPELQGKLRIGTVDAFQGMEFDVVFLSVVRSPVAPTRELINKEHPGLPKSRIFGHLQSDNRVCVSMSRQKKCLIVVGDASLFEMPVATAAVPAIQRYLTLCRNSKYGAYIHNE